MEILYKAIFSKPKKPVEKPPTVMPDEGDPSQRQAARRRTSKAQGMGGRSSTMMNDAYSDETMG